MLVWCEEERSRYSDSGALTAGVVNRWINHTHMTSHTHARVAFQKDIRDCNVLCFTETWLTGDTLSELVQPAGFFTHRADRNKHLPGRKKGGGVHAL